MPKTIVGGIGLVLVPVIASGLLAFTVGYSNRGALSDQERKADERVRDAELELAELRAIGTAARVRVGIETVVEHDEVDAHPTAYEAAHRVDDRARARLRSADARSGALGAAAGDGGERSIGEPRGRRRPLVAVARLRCSRCTDRGGR